jgi:hypothetical protein
MTMFVYINCMVVRQGNDIARGCFQRFTSGSSKLGRTGRAKDQAWARWKREMVSIQKNAKMYAKYYKLSSFVAKAAVSILRVISSALLVAFKENSARMYRPAFSWKQAQNARIQSLTTSVLGLLSRKLCLWFREQVERLPCLKLYTH